MTSLFGKVLEWISFRELCRHSWIVFPVSVAAPTPSTATYNCCQVTSNLETRTGRHLWPCRCCCYWNCIQNFTPPISWIGNECIFSVLEIRESRWCSTITTSTVQVGRHCSSRIVLDKLSTFIPFGSVRLLPDWIWIVLLSRNYWLPSTQVLTG